MTVLRVVRNLLLVLLLMVLFVVACGTAIVAGAYLFVKVAAG